MISMNVSVVQEITLMSAPLLPLCDAVDVAESLHLYHSYFFLTQQG